MHVAQHLFREESEFAPYFSVDIPVVSSWPVRLCQHASSFAGYTEDLLHRCVVLNCSTHAAPLVTY